MDEKTKTELALFRFSLIAPLVNGSCEKSQKEYLEEICAKRYDVPGLGYREFSTATVKGWLSLYRRYGLEVFFASENSSLLQKVFPRHRWGIFMLT